MSETTYSTVAENGIVVETTDPAEAEWWSRLGARVTAHTSKA